MRKITGEKGAAAVEAALILPILLMLIIAIAEYGIFFLKSYQVQQITYEAARAGAMSSTGKAAAAEDKVTALLSAYELKDTPTVTVDATNPDYTTVTLTLGYSSVTNYIPVPGEIKSKFQYANF